MRQYIVDAFTDTLFCGNQAAVCVVEEWLPEAMMLNIAKENNFSETAFTRKNADGSYDLRWFTPAAEIDFCGHATLGTSFVLLNYYETEAAAITFHTRFKGDFYVYRTEEGIRMDFPAFELHEIPVTDEMEQVFGARPIEAYMDRDLLCVFEDDRIVREMKPTQENLAKLSGVCLTVTAPGRDGYDSTSRVFAPELSIYEDPVTGSTHCMIAPYWASKLGKNIISAYQASARGGELRCEVKGDKVSIIGKAVLFAVSELQIG